MALLLSRRDVVTAAAAVATAGMASASRPKSSRPPNVVFIMADDLGYADVSCYGRREYQTPSIDRLAQDGVRLLQGYANSPVCSASRTALITGRYQYRLPVGLEEPLSGRITSPPLSLPAGFATLPSLFRQEGYRTALIGKWHLGLVDGKGPLVHGYDHFFGFHLGEADYFHEAPQPSVPGSGLYENERPVTRDGYLTDVLGDEAARWIGRDRQPFLLSLHFNAPHSPWQAREDGPADGSPVPGRYTPRGSLETFARMVGALDDNIGKVLAALVRHDVDRDTIVVFTSDNGGERYSDVWPFTGMKGELLEGGLRVPLIVRWPGRIAAGTTSQQVMTSMDFLPTLLAVTGGTLDATSPPDGVNLMPVLTGASDIVQRRLFWRYKNHDQRAMRDGDWKYLRINGNEYLFDVAADPRERLDRKRSNATVFTALKSRFDAWNATMLPYPGDSFSYRPRTADRYWE